MTSRNYLFKGIKENIRRNFYLMVLIMLAFLAALPVWTMMQMEYAKYLEQAPGNPLNPVQQEFLNCVGTVNVAVAIVVIGAGILLGMTGFFYLYSGEKTDFYHSLPLKREQLFLTSFCSDFVIFLVPYLVSLGITCVVGLVYGGITVDAAVAAGAAVGINILYFLVIYAVAVLAVLLTGNLFTGVLGFAGLMTYGLIVYATYNFMNSRFFVTMAQFETWELTRYLSPIGAYISALDGYGRESSVKGCILYGIILAAVVLAADVYIYKIRPSESFQKAIAFQKLQPVFKVLCVLPVSMLAGLFFSSGMTHRFAWMVVSGLIAAVLLSAAFEFLYTMDIRKCIRPRISTGIILAVLLLTIGGYRLDLAGVDSYLPKKEKIESMSIYFNSINDRIIYPASYEWYNIGRYLDENTMENFDAVYELAETGMEYYETDRKTQDADLTKETILYGANGIETDAEGVTMVSFYIAYHLKSGKDVYRRYYVPETEELVKTIAEVYDSWEYREKMLPTTYLKQDSLEYLYVKDFHDVRKQLDLKRDELENLYKTYKSELESMTFAQSRENRIIGYLIAEQKINTSYGDTYTDNCELPVYENFSKTRGLLEQAGLPLADSISPDTVFNIKLYRYNQEGEFKEAVFEETEEIETILENLTFGDGYYGVGSSLNYNVNVEINWKDRNQGTQTTLSLVNGEALEGILKQLNDD